MARIKKTPPKSVFSIRSITLTPEVTEALLRLSGDATDFTGRAVSGSAMIRALVRYADKQGEQWVRSEVLPYVEEEVRAGATWGKQHRFRPE
jgi:hypothetical protein